MSIEVLVLADAEQVAAAAAERLVTLIRETILRCGRCTIALSGGSTPGRLYRILAELPEGTIEWSHVHALWGDERNVPLDSRESNFRMVREALLDPLGKRGPNIYPVPIDPDQPQATAERYQETLRQLLQASTSAQPQLDVALLGLGDDAHTASLFPGTAALEASSDWVVANWVPKLDSYRITLTAALLNLARLKMFLVCGASKTWALDRVWHYRPSFAEYPAQLIEPAGGSLCWYIDQAALGTLELPKPPASV
jgi:6-phosphogluconolactonase